MLNLPKLLYNENFVLINLINIFQNKKMKNEGTKIKERNFLLINI